MRLSAIKTIFSRKNVFAATKIQKQAPWVFCKRRSVTLLLERGSIITAFFYSVFNNTCFQKHLWAAACKNQHLSDKVRSSHPLVFCKKGVPTNFAKFTVNHLCQNLLFNKVAGLRLWHRCVPVNFVKFLRLSFFTKISATNQINQYLDIKSYILKTKWRQVSLYTNNIFWSIS